MATASINDPVPPTDPTANPPFLRRVRIRGYKSIAFCDVYLQPLTILIGRNSSGKSNFLDALAFLSDVVAKGTDEAVRLHGGRNSILNRSGDQSTISFEIESSYQDEASRQTFAAEYKIEIGLPVKAKPFVVSERLRITSDSDREAGGFERGDERLKIRDKYYQFGDMESICPVDRAFLFYYPPIPVLELGEGIESAGFYNFSPDAIRKLQVPDPGSRLGRTGQNLASAIEGVGESDQDSLDRIQAFLSVIVEEVEGFKVVHYGEFETIRFQLRSGGGQSLEFDAASMSDGTLRVLATLVAAFQVQPGGPRVIGIEEPETALHPAAMRALVEALDEASGQKQILLTTHSADLLTDLAPRWSQVLIVKNVEGQTQITPVDAASREIIEKELYTLADLQRQDLLELNQADLKRQSEAQAGTEE
jgi:predicted ATPase